MHWKIKVGTATLYGIRDGAADRDPLEFLIGSTPEALVGYERYLTADGKMRNSFSCYLWDDGSTKVMVDTGFGYNAHEGADAGEMPAALDALGVSPADIDHVVFTHMHPDHILGSMTSEWAPLFANAAHWTLHREVGFWRAGSDERARGIARVADALDEAGVLNAVEDPGSVVPGVVTVPTYGHSPGHVAVRLSSGDDTVVITGDVTFSPMQLDHTDWSFPFDVDKPAAATTRAAFFDMLAESGEPFAAGHFDRPGFGRIVVTAEGRRFEALPVESL